MAQEFLYRGNLHVHLSKTVGHLFEFRLEAFQDADLRAEDGFQVRRGEANGGSSCVNQELRRERGLAGPAGTSQNLEKGLRRGLKESFFRWEGGQKAERGGRKRIEEAEDLGENDPEIAFDLVFEGDDLNRDVLSLTG